MKKKTLRILFFAFGLIFLVLNISKFREFEDLISFERGALNYYKRSFSGKIVKKFIDQENHSAKKIVLQNGNTSAVVQLDFEKDELYNYLQVGDFLLKEANQTKILLKRNGYDSIFTFNFDEYVDRNKYHQSLDSVVLKYLDKIN